MQDRLKVMADFKATDVSFHTYTPAEEKPKKIVLKGAPEMDVEEIKEDLRKRGSPVQEIIKLKTRRAQESFSYLVTVNKNQSLQELRQIKNIEQCGISWERYNKKNTYTQCFNCQAFGHAESNCHLKPKCVKCPGHHHWKQCNIKRTQTSKAYCHNCNGDHAASFKQCPALLEYLQKRNEIALAKNTKQHVSKPPTTTPEIRPPLNIQGIQMKNNVKLSYREVTENKFHGDLGTPINSNTQDDELGELLGLLNIVKNIKNELKTCRSQYDKMAVIIKYLDKF